jgi:acyl carrier protein
VLDKNVDTQRIMESAIEHASRLLGGDISRSEVDRPLVALGFDSRRTVQLVALLEQQFDIELPETLLVPETFETLNSLVWAFRQEATPVANPSDDGGPVSRVEGSGSE